MPTRDNQVGTEAGGGVHMLTSRMRALEAMNQSFQDHVVKKDPFLGKNTHKNATIVSFSSAKIAF